MIVQLAQAALLAALPLEPAARSPESVAQPVPDPPVSESTAAEPPAAALAAADEEKMNEWTGSVTLGVSSAFGNTERTNANLSANAVLRREKDRFTLGSWWYYAEEEFEDGSSEITDRRYGGQGKYDYFLSKKSYLLVNALGERDDRSDLQLRFTAGLGYGYQFKEEPGFKLAAELGLQYFVEDFRTPEPTDEEPSPAAVGAEGHMAARAAFNVMYKPDDDWTFSQSAEAFPSLEDSDDFYSKLDTRVRYDLSSNLFAQFQWLWDYDNTPAQDKDRSDHRLLLTVGYSF